MTRPEVAVGAIILDAEDKVFLMQSRKWSGKLIIPGGHVEAGETLQQALIREILEETSLDIEILHLVDSGDFIYPESFERKAHFIFFTYLCRAKSHEVKLEEREAEEYFWLPLDEAIGRDDLNQSTREALIKAKDGPLGYRFDSLHRLMTKLREECPWDRDQDLSSLHKDLKSEMQELFEGIEKEDWDNIEEEIGDCFSSLLLLSIIAEESGKVNLAESIKRVIEKMIRRHPHVFGDLKGKDLSKEEVMENWKKIKESEKKNTFE